MSANVQVSFRNIDNTGPIEETCDQEIEKLQRHYERMTSCRVVVSQPHRQHRKGNAYEVGIVVVVPGGEVVVDHETPAEGPAKDPSVAVREAFGVCRRRLEDHFQKVRGD